MAKPWPIAVVQQLVWEGHEVAYHSCTGEMGWYYFMLCIVSYLQWEFVFTTPKFKRKTELVIHINALDIDCILHYQVLFVATASTTVDRLLAVKNYSNSIITILRFILSKQSTMQYVVVTRSDTFAATVHSTDKIVS